MRTDKLTRVEYIAFLAEIKKKLEMIIISLYVERYAYRNLSVVNVC